MLYLLDYSNFIETKKVYGLYSSSNTTSNPIINLKESKKFLSTLKEIREILGKDSMLHIQIVGNKSEKIIEIVKSLRENIGGNLYIKTANTFEGLDAVKSLSQEGISIIATNISTQQKFEGNVIKTEYILVKLLENNKTVYRKVISKFLSSPLSNTKLNGFVSDWRKL